MGKRISSRPSDFEEGGGKFGIPSGAIFVITGATATNWEDAGESAIKGERQPDDPCLRLDVEIEGIEEARAVHLGAGKATRMVPSEDGEFFEQADESTASGLNKNCNAAIFLASLVDKKKHGTKTFDERKLDDGYSSLIGLRAVADNVAADRDFGDQEERKRKPTNLVVKEILDLPGKSTKKAKAKGKAKDEDEDDAKPKGKKKDEDEDDGSDSDDAELAEKIIVKALKEPKYAADGMHKDKVYTVVVSRAKKMEGVDEDAVGKVVEDEDWVTDGDRPWEYDEDTGLLTKA